MENLEEDCMLYRFLCNVCAAEAAIDGSLNIHQFNPTRLSLNMANVE